MTIANPLRSMLNDNKLIGPNFTDWVRNLRIVLKSEWLEYVIDEEEPELPAPGAGDEALAKFQKFKEDANSVQCLMLSTMSNELQKQHMDMDPRSMMKHLTELYAEQSRTERYELSKSLFRSRMAEGTSVHAHMLKMIEKIERLASLGFKLPAGMDIDLVLQSLPDSYSNFVVNYHMNKIESSLPILHNMLKTAEGSILKEKPQVLLIGKSDKKRKAEPSSSGGKGKKAKRPARKKKNDVKAKGECHFCGAMGHWKRNCKKYLDGLAKSKKKAPDASEGIYMIDVYLTSHNCTSWVLDTGCTSHICNDVQAMRSRRKLRTGEVMLTLGSGAKVVVVSVGCRHQAPFRRIILS